jgi:long-subunit fatty acid transport protein
MASRVRGVVVGSVCVLLAPAVWANPYNIYGASPEGTALGGATTADADDASASFYNPAGLGFMEEGEIQVQFLSINPRLEIQRLKQDSEVVEALPENNFGVNLAIGVPIIKGKLGFGATLYVPNGTKLLQVQSLEPQRPQFYMYQSLHNRFEIVPSIGYRPIPQVSLGVGAEISTNINANLQAQIVAIDPETQVAQLERDLVADADILISPIAGVTLQPIPQLKLGFTFRGKNDGTVILDTTTDIAGLADLDLKVTTTSFFIPNQFSFGASYQATPQVKLLATVDRDLWSQASNPETLIATAVNVEGSEPIALDTQEITLGFVDVTVPRFGIELRPFEGLDLRAGYFFRKTHIPTATNNDIDSTLLDNNVHAISLGGAYHIANPLLIKQSPFTVEAAYQVQAMAAGAVGKEDPNDPVGNVGFGGQVHSVFLSMSQRF